MSAPRTPAEMADWLDELVAAAPDGRVSMHSREVCLLADMLRAAPTDAQKIEALQAERMATIRRLEYLGILQTVPTVGPPPEDEATMHRKALRLLGLPTE